MKTIFSYIRTYRVAAMIAILLMAVELVVELVQPIIMSIIIDQGVENKDLTTVTKWTVVLLGLSAVAFIAGIASSFFASKTSQGVGHDLRRDLFSRIQSFSAKQIQSLTTSTLLTRMTNDVTQIQALVFTGLRIMLRAPLFIIGGMIMSLTVDFTLGIILIFSVPFLLIIMLWIMQKGVKLFQHVQEKLDSLTSLIGENISSIRLIKAYHRGDYEKQRFKQVNSSLMDVNKKALRLMELTMPIVMLGINLSIVLILWFGSTRLQAGEMNAGDLVAILNYGTRILGSFGVFSFLIMNFSRGRASAGRVSEVLEEACEEEVVAANDGRQVVKGRISFQNVTYTYPGLKNKALDHVSFDIGPGQKLGILGETGSGKSTLLSLIPRLFDATAGRIVVDNRPIEEWNKNVLRKNIGFVSQEAHLFSGSMKDNIAWGKEAASLSEIEEAAKDAQIESFIMSLPNQYDTQLGQKGVNLSGGQKQRLSLARALVRNPSLLLLDDSTSALDAHTEKNVLHAIKRRKCTTIIVAQKISSIIDADKILLLQQGELVASGSHESLLKTSDLYAKIYQSQMQKGVDLNASKK